MTAPWPLTAFHFEVCLAGDDTPAHAAFAEVSGLDSERIVEEIVEGGENAYVHRVPGRARQTNLVLRRGLVGTRDPLFLWCKAAFEGELPGAIVPMAVQVRLLNEEHRPVVMWYCDRAWPVKWSIGKLDAQRGEVAMEALELAYARLTRRYAWA